jgi:protein-tyrosine kinase
MSSGAPDDANPDQVNPDAGKVASGSELTPPGASFRSIVPRSDGAIGEILVKSGRLSREDAERILAVQSDRGVRFGDTGREMGLLSQADIDFALALQFDYPYLQPGDGRVSEQVITAFDPFCRLAESLRALRSELVLRWFDGSSGHRALVVVGTLPNEGRSFIAANLAVVFSQLGKRTLLVDGDLRNPSLYKLFRMDNRIGLSTVLSGRAGLEAIQHIPSLRYLSLLPSGVLPPNPQELLGRPALAVLLEEFRNYFDIVIIDSPPTAHFADARTLAARAGAAMIVSRRNQTGAKEVQRAVDDLASANVSIVGSVLNDY